VGNKKAANITRDDLMGGGCALVSCFIAEPEFVGQTKDRLATTEAARMVEAAVRDHFDNWLAANTKAAGRSSISSCSRAEERLRRRRRRRRRANRPRRSCACPASWWTAPNRPATGRSCSSSRATARAARPRWRAPQDQALLPLRGKILNVLGAASSKLGQNAEISDLCQALGVGMGTKFNIEDLRYDKVIIMTDADVDGAHIASLLMTFFFTQMRPLIDKGPPLPRLPAALPADPGRDARLRHRRVREGAPDGGAGRQGQDRRLALQGPGRDGRQGPEGNHDGPGVAQADPRVGGSTRCRARPATWWSG
jgi:topoisomerase-4 subunit B